MKMEINKGNYEMDTEERIFLVEKIRAEGWEEGYEKYRNRWNNNPKKLLVEEYPINLDIELTTICNLRCPMCFTTKDDFKDNVVKKHMDFELYKKIIDEVKGKVPAIKFASRGETTLYPKFIECVRYAKENGIKEILMVTNGSTMTKEYFKKLVEAGIDYITISIDGIGEEYEKVRKPMIYKEILEKLSNMKKIKAELNSKKPIIKVQGIWEYMKGVEEDYYNNLVGITDLIAYNPLMQYGESGGWKEKPCEDGFVCAQIYQRLFINVDGLVQPCCCNVMDEMIVGDVKRTSIREIWNGSKINGIRNMFNTKNAYYNHPLCGTCGYSAPMETKGSIKINGRNVVITGYK